MRSYVRSAALTGYAELAQSLGLDPYARLREAKLDVACLNNPDLRIPVTHVSQLLEASAQASGIEDFGLRLAASRRLSNLGLIALAARDEPTVRDAMACLHRSLHMHNDALHIVIDDSDGMSFVRVQVLARLHGSMRQGVELTLGAMFRYVRGFIGAHWVPKSVHFMHSTPRDLAPYRRFFGVVPQFNSVLNGMTVRPEDLDQPMPDADADSLRIIRQYVQSAAVHHETQSERTMHLILGLLPTGRCSVDLVARYIGIDRRSLHRRLEAEGTSFTELVERMRQEAAPRHLANSAHSVTELATMLGFSDSSAFSRWFSRHFGMSPRAWRTQHKALPGSLPTPSTDA